MGQTPTKSCDESHELSSNRNTCAKPDSVDHITIAVDRNHESELSGSEETHRSRRKLSDHSSVKDSTKHLPVVRTLKDCLLYGLHEWRCACLTVIVITCVMGTCLCELLRHLAPYQAKLDAQQHDYSAEQLETNLSLYQKVINKAFCCQNTYLVICGALLFLFYLVYLIECWNSAIWMRAVYCIDTQSAYRFVDALRRTIPVVYWHVSCYHYSSNRTTRTVTNPHTVNHNAECDETVSQVNPTTLSARPQSPLHTRSTTPTNTEWISVPAEHRVLSQEHKVITASGTRIFDLGQLNGMWDLSGEVAELENYPLIEINIQTECLFSNEETKVEFERERCAFYTSFEKYDTYIETNQVIQLSPHGTVPSQIFVSRSAPKVPIYMRQSTFLLSALFLLSFPLRIFIYSRTARLDYTVRKIFGPLQLPTGQTGSTGVHNTAAIPCDLVQSSTTDPLSSGRLSNRMRLEKNHTAIADKNNNEAVVLCNRNISFDSFTQTEDSVKSKRRWKRVHEDGPSDDRNEEEEEEDEELLSLDIRFEEFDHGINVCENILPNKYVTQDSPDIVYSVQ